MIGCTDSDPGSAPNRVFPLRYAYRWTDTTTGGPRQVVTTSRDGAYESADGIRRIQIRRERHPDAVVVTGLGAHHWFDTDITPGTATGESITWIPRVDDIAIIAQICREIVADVTDEVLPTDIADFDALHDHVDAGLHARQHVAARERVPDQHYADFITPIQDLVTDWLRTGRPPTFVVTAPIGPVIIQLLTPIT